MIVSCLRSCGGCCSSSEELQGVLKTNDAEATLSGVEFDAGADSLLVDETHENLNEPLGAEVLKEFRAKLSQGIKYPVILEDGNTRPCELKLLVDERENRKELMMSSGGENCIMRFEDIHQAKAGKDLGTVEVPIPLDDLCGTIVLKSNDCVSFKFSSIEARDHFVDGMNDVIYSYTMIVEDTGCLDELDTLKNEQAPTVTSAEEQVDGEPPCTLESFNGHWFSDRHGSKMGEIRDGTIRWEAASFKKYMKSDHQLEPMKIDFTDNRIHISVWNGMHFASKSEDKLIWSDGDIWRRTEK